MQEQTDFSYGVIPIFSHGDSWQVLLIKQIGRRGDQFWTFPKGHPEPTETPLTTATRELQEETGVVAARISEEPTFVTEYIFMHEGVRIHKQVTYYLGYCQTQTTHVSQPFEIAELCWCSYKQALALLSHHNTKSILNQVKQYLDTL